MNLYEYLDTNTALTMDDKINIVLQVAKGMEFAHSKEIIHRDLHLGNILKKANDFLICDFVLSKDLTIERSLKSSYNPKNNHRFVDPIRLDNFNLLDKKSDIYSVGNIMEYMMNLHSRSNNPYKSVIEKAIIRDRQFRYDNFTDIIKDIIEIKEGIDLAVDKERVLQSIRGAVYSIKVRDSILKK